MGGGPPPRLFGCGDYIYLTSGDFPMSWMIRETQIDSTSRGWKKEWMVKVICSSGCHTKKTFGILYRSWKPSKWKRINFYQARTGIRGREINLFGPVLSEFRGLKIPANRSWLSITKKIMSFLGTESIAWNSNNQYQAVNSTLRFFKLDNIFFGS